MSHDVKWCSQFRFQNNFLNSLCLYYLNTLIIDCLISCFVMCLCVCVCACMCLSPQLFLSPSLPLFPKLNSCDLSDSVKTIKKGNALKVYTFYIKFFFTNNSISMQVEDLALSLMIHIFRISWFRVKMIVGDYSHFHILNLLFQKFWVNSQLGC